MKWAASHLKISWILALLLLIGCLLGAKHIMDGSGGIDFHLSKREQPDKNPARNSSNQRYGPTSVGVAIPDGDVVALGPNIPGEVVEVLVKSGDHVKKGQVLLRMDDRLARTNLTQAEGVVQSATAQVKVAQTALDTFPILRARQLTAIQSARKKWEMATIEVDNIKSQKDKGINYSQTSYANAIKLQEQAALGITNEEDKLKEIDFGKSTLENQVELARGNLKTADGKLSSAKLGLEYCELKAPADGTISDSYVAVGTKFGEQALRLAFKFYTGGLVVKADITQESASRVKQGQAVVVEDAAGGDQTWTGHVSKVDNKYTNKRDSGSIVGLPEQAQDPVLECRITLDTDKAPPLLNQKVRVKFVK
jgi:multidrug resistance efflux pump